MGWYKVLALFGFIQSLVTIGSLLTSQPLLFPLNDFESFENQGDEQINRPGIIAIYETVMAVCVVIVSIVIGITKPKKPYTIISGVIFLVLFVLSCIWTVERASTMGTIDFLSEENTCRDTNRLTGCPTTVFKETNYTIESKDHCKFNAYGETVYPHDAANSDPLIDWSNIEFYDIVKKPTLVEKAQLADNTLESDDIGPISYCWYWACDSICNEKRYRLNQAWLMVSTMNTVFYLLGIVFSGLAFNDARKDELDRAEDYPIRQDYTKVKLRY